MTDTADNSRNQESKQTMLSDPTYLVVQPVMYEVRSTKPATAEPDITEETSPAEDCNNTDTDADKDDTPMHIEQETANETETAEQTTETVTDDTVELDMKAILQALQSQNLLNPSTPLPETETLSAPEPQKETRKPADLGDIFSKFVDRIPEKKQTATVETPKKKRGIEHGTFSYHVFMTMFSKRESLQFVFDGLITAGILLALYLLWEGINTGVSLLFVGAAALAVPLILLYVGVLIPDWKNARTLRKMMLSESKQQLTRKELKTFIKTIRQEENFNTVQKFTIPNCSWQLLRDGDEFTLCFVDSDEPVFS